MTISSPLTPFVAPDEASKRAAERAAAHSTPTHQLRAAQRWQEGVSDTDAARVLLALEHHHVRPYRNGMGRWMAPGSTALAGMNWHLSVVIKEMVRTGLLREWRDREGDHLIPAPVHLLVREDDTQGPARSACLFAGEDMGPMRARLITRLDLVDCLACESSVANGTVRGL